MADVDITDEDREFASILAEEADDPAGDDGELLEDEDATDDESAGDDEEAPPEGGDAPADEKPAGDAPKAELDPDAEYEELFGAPPKSKTAEPNIEELIAQGIKKGIAELLGQPVPSGGGVAPEVARINATIRANQQAIQQAEAEYNEEVDDLKRQRLAAKILRIEADNEKLAGERQQTEAKVTRQTVSREIREEADRVAKTFPGQYGLPQYPRGLWRDFVEDVHAGDPVAVTINQTLVSDPEKARRQLHHYAVNGGYVAAAGPTRPIKAGALGGALGNAKGADGAANASPGPAASASGRPAIKLAPEAVDAAVFAGWDKAEIATAAKHGFNLCKLPDIKAYYAFKEKTSK